MRYQYYFLDLLPYFIIGILLIICILTKVLNKSKKSNLIFVCLLVFVVLRYDVGWDYSTYQAQIIAGETARYEPLSKLIFDFGHNINFYPIVFIFFGFFTLFLTKKTIDQYSKNVVLSWIIFYGLPFLFMASLSTIRQSLATAIIFYSVHFAIKKRYLIFILCIIIAYFFHSSAIIGVFLYPLLNIRIKKSALFGLFFLSLLMDNFFGEILQNFAFQLTSTFKALSYYLDNPNEDYQMSKLKIVLNVICFITLILYDKIIFKSELSRKFLTVSTIGVIFFNSFIFEPNTAYRVGAFFMQFWVLLLPQYIFYVKEKSKIRELILASFFLVFHGIMIYLLISAYNSTSIEKIGVIPYKFWFNYVY